MSNKTCQNCGSELRTCGKCGWSKVYEEDMSELREETAEFRQESKRWKGIVEKQHLSTIKYKDRVEKEIEQLRADKAALKWKIERFQNMYERESNLVTTFHQKNEQLKAQNASLLEGLNEIMDKEMMRYQCDTPAYTIARKCIAKLGGTADES